MNYRTEKDSLGYIQVPKNALYGSHTQRSLNNFSVSGCKSDPQYIYSIVIVKKAAAKVNSRLGLINKKFAKAIVAACDEILSGNFSDQFPIDVYQSGAGTSINMNVNEVIANRANQTLHAPLGSYKYIHPNDHVNMSQSTNDVIPTAIRITTIILAKELMKNISNIRNTFSKKSGEFENIIKPGRTHLQDALPITLGKEFAGYSQTLDNDLKRIKISIENVKKLGIGGTAVGTGINTHPEYQRQMIAQLRLMTDIPLKSSGNLVESMQNQSDFVHLSECLKILSQNLVRICQDLRLLSSGPNSGFGEISLPAVVPGSSIMPGKVNPSICEMTIMVCMQVLGFDLSITLASMSGQLELNVMLPLITFDLISQIKLLTNSIYILDKKCISGIQANRARCMSLFENSSGVAAVLNPYLGYVKTAELVKESIKSKKNIKQLVLEKKLLSEEKLKQIFDVKNITKPNLK